MTIDIFGSMPGLSFAVFHVIAQCGQRDQGVLRQSELKEAGMEFMTKVDPLVTSYRKEDR